jgi:hypothetical protein
MRENDVSCAAHWSTNTSPCPIEPGEHTCWRSGEHRTHLCECGEIRLPAVAASARPCGHRWSEGRPCAEINHVCLREGEHDTHVCTCLATDTPTRSGVAV